MFITSYDSSVDKSGMSMYTFNPLSNILLLSCGS